MRRYALIALLACSLGPGLAYEALQKSAEHWAAPGTLPRLGAEAELLTPWRPRTGNVWVDHTVHELQETRTFYRLAGRRLARTLLG